MLDEGADFLSRDKERIEGEYGIPCAIPSYDIFDLANDKQKLMELCKKFDLPHPRTEEIVAGDLKKVADYVVFPAMIKPNISALARKYKLNRATVKKYYESGGMPQKMRLKRNSKYDEYDELIREKMSDSLVKISALYQYMKNIYKDKINFTYSGLKSYIERKGYRNINSNIVPHVLYETGPGEQLQCDWKEDLSIELILDN